METLSINDNIDMLVPRYKQSFPKKTPEAHGVAISIEELAKKSNQIP